MRRTEMHLGFHRKPEGQRSLGRPRKILFKRDLEEIG
jgi:hypothetical protein